MSTPDFVATIPVRFRDLDPMGHVNNAVYASYLEQTRAEFYREVLGERLDEIGTVLVHLELDFERPVHLGDEVDVELSIESVGTSSLAMDYTVRANDEVVATARTVQVVIDEDGEAVPVPTAWRERLEDG